MKYRKLVSMLMASVLLVTGIQPGSMLSVSAETEPAEAALSGAEPLATSDNSFGAMLAAGINEQQAQIQSGCNIYNVEMFGNAARVHFDASRDGKLVVALYEDIGGEQAPRLIGTGMQEVAAGEQQDEYVTISTFASMPEYYLIRAYLIGSNGMPLSPEYENQMHTKEMINLLGSDINDYAGYEVLNLDDDVNTNFAVYNTDVTVLKSSSTENVVTEQDPETGVYKISNYTGPTRSGEFVSIEGDGNSVTIFKIKSVTKSGSVTTVYANTDAETNDAFAFIKIETDSSRDQVSYTPPEDSEVPVTGEVVSDQKKQKRPAAASAQAAEDESGETDADGRTHKSDYLKFHFQIGGDAEDETKAGSKGGTKTAGIDVSANVELNVSYEISYYETKLYNNIDLNLDINASITGECNLTAAVKLPLGSAIAINPCSSLKLELGPYFTASITGKVVIGEIALSTSYSSDSGFQTDINVDLGDLSAEGFVGLGLGGELSLGERGANIDLVAGFKSELSSADAHEGCNRCMEGTISLECTASVGAKIWKLDYTKEFSFGLELGKFYVSDTLGFGWGECPNKIEKPEKDPEEDPEKDPEEEPNDGLTAEQRAMFSFKPSNYGGYRISLKASKYGENKKQSNDQLTKLRSDITTLDLPDYYKGQPVTEIDQYAFTCCRNLQIVEFPSSLTEIGDRAFYGCPRLKIDLPNTIKTIGKEAFACPSSYVSTEISYTVTLPVMLESIGPNAFDGRENIDKMVIPDFIHLKPVENVGYFWFGRMPKLQEIVMPSDWTLIPWGFAERMPALERVTMPAFVKTIQPNAFKNTAIRTINIPDTVQVIGLNAFYDCKNLMEIDIPSSVKKIDYFAFSGCESLESIVIPESVDTLFFSAFRSMKNLKSVTILNQNIKIDDLFMFDPIYETGDVWDQARDCLLWNREQLVIYGYEGSTAQQFAENPKYNFKFVALEKPAAGTTTAGTTSSGTTPAGTTPVTEPEQPKDEPKTITFTDLKPNTIYNFYDLLGDEFIAKNLLYLSQGVSDENGTLTIWYRPAKDDTDANKFVKRFVSQPVMTVAGDLTCDGHVDVSDAVALLRFLNEDKSVKISDQGITNADANRDGQVDSDDCTVILQFIARIIREI